jgi:biotin transport system permease protein
MQWTTQRAGPHRLMWLGRWPAGLKIVLLIVVSGVLVAVSSPWPLGLAAVFATALWTYVAGPLTRQTWLTGRWVVFTIACVVLYIGLVSSWAAAFVVLCRLLALMALAMVVMATTPVSAIMDWIERLLKPLGRRGWVNPAKVALLFGLVLRFVPVLFAQWHEIREAQAARGLAAQPHALLVPMILRTLERAEDIAQAIDARNGLS